MKHFLKYFVGALALMAVLVFICLRSLPDGNLHIFVMDVGQGDSILIETPGRELILVDGGPDDRIVQRLSEILPFYERTIDILILTHPHADHINGLVEVLKRYHVRQTLMTGVASPYAGYDEFLALLYEQQVPIFFIGNGNDYQVGQIILDMLYPFDSLQNEYFSNLNNSSITFRLIYGKNIFYFSGDLEKEGEDELLAAKFDLRADFLKAPHHGSKTSSSETFLDSVNPKYVAISCGVDNKFGHPYFLTIEHYQKRYFEIYRTDLDGTIEALSDGKDLLVRAWGKT